MKIYLVLSGVYYENRCEAESAHWLLAKAKIEAERRSAQAEDGFARVLELDTDNHELDLVEVALWERGKLVER